MINEEIIQKTAAYVKEKLSGENSGHGWEHAKAVWGNAKEILKTEPAADRLITEIAALLHDIHDWKLAELNDEDSAGMAKDWLVSLGLGEELISKVEEIILKVSFFGPNFVEEQMSLEGQIVRDADRLEALGAIAWERTVQFGKAKGIPDINEYLPNLNLTDEEYKNYRRKENSAINHVFEKYLLLKNRLSTKRGRELGELRHEELKNVVRNYLEGIRGKGLVFDSRIEEYLTMLDEPRFA